MNLRNTTDVSEFLLRGFPYQPEVQSLLFPLFLSIYLLTLLGNMTIILLIRSDTHLLHTPMYFLLSHLALADLGFTSTTIPKALHNMLSQKKTISYPGCLAQMYFYGSFGNSDTCLLASMAYDRYVAICCPLHYSAMMSHKRCLQLATVSWIVPLIPALLYTLLMSRLEFCDPEEIPDFFCDVFPLLAICCSDTTLVEIMVMTEGVMEVVIPFALIVISYSLIFYTIMKIPSAVMKIPSAVGKRKAFSTCGSHISVVVLFYGGVIWIYFKPNAKNPGLQDTVVTVMYTMVTPMLNPFIYTLRNSEMKSAMRRVIRRHFY
ncbi:PREDICTED: olfactory receptor-like protein DTMT [Gekko japonicus]|uniref:Olfactory receptor n=1 Tax=Gekko japonicus TaxID=146911 RepID=A0ABM1LD50_GEKJA|nr:PREDICTED: olfactory receptor-like protein DTMT [Gekko japonicus]